MLLSKFFETFLESSEPEGTLILTKKKKSEFGVIVFGIKAGGSRSDDVEVQDEELMWRLLLSGTLGIHDPTSRFRKIGSSPHMQNDI